MYKLLFTILIGFNALNASALTLPPSPIEVASEIFFNAKVNTLYKKALGCSILEKDPESGITAKEWIKSKPQIPNWLSMTQFLIVAHKAHDYAEKQIGSDKVKHCFAGCFVRKNLNLKSAIMVGWLKELSDASDCDPETHFEKADYLATVAGAIAGKNHHCKDFCQSDELVNATGKEMLQSALRSE